MSNTPPTYEAAEKADGWTIIRKCKTAGELAKFVNDPKELLELDLAYPLNQYRRKVDIVHFYVAVKIREHEPV